MLDLVASTTTCDQDGKFIVVSQWVEQLALYLSRRRDVRVARVPTATRIFFLSLVNPNFLKARPAQRNTIISTWRRRYTHDTFRRKLNSRSHRKPAKRQLRLFSFSCETNTAYPTNFLTRCASTYAAIRPFEVETSICCIGNSSSSPIDAVALVCGKTKT